MNTKPGDKKTHYRKTINRGPLVLDDSIFRIAFENSNTGKSITRIGGEIYVNSAFCRMLGYTSGELQNKRWQDITPEEEIGITQNEIDKLLSGEINSSRFKKNFIHSNGTLVWTDVSFTLERDNKGNPNYFITTVIDLSEQKKTEESLLKAQELFHKAFNSSPAPMSIQRQSDGAYIEVNNSFLRLTESLREDVVGKSGKEINLLDSESRNQISCLLNETDRIYNLEIKAKSRSGKILNLLSSHEKVIVGTEPCIVSTMIDISDLISKDEELKRIEWLLASRDNVNKFNEPDYVPPYGDLLALNTSRLILDSVGESTLKDIVSDYLNLLETSAAVYEKNGDYALGIFSSGWCRMMDAGSRNLCNTENNRKAIDSGLWLCHESCWKDASKASIETGSATDIECNGGIRLFAVPIKVHDEIIGSINFGYGDPPKDESKLSELAEKYKLDPGELRKASFDYETRPAYIIEQAKKRLQVSARLIGEITERRLSEKALRKSEEKFSILFNKSTLPVVLTDFPEHRFVDVNEAWINLFGYTKNEVLGKTSLETGLMKNTEKRNKVIKSLSENKNVRALERTLYTKNGNELKVLTELNLIEIGGNPYTLHSMLDITSQRLAEDKLKAYARELDVRNRILQVFLSVSDEEMYGKVLEIILEVMQSRFGVFGFLNERGDLVVPTMTRTVWSNCLVPDKRIVFPTETWSCSSWPTAIREKRMIYSNNPSTLIPKGHIQITRHISLPIIHMNEVIGLLQVANKESDYDKNDLDLLDIIGKSVAPVLDARLNKERQETIRLKSDMLLKESEQRFRETVINLDEGYYSVTIDGKLLDHNNSFNRILGFETNTDLKGINLPDFWQNPEDRKAYLNHLLQKGNISNYQIKAKMRSGEKIVVIASSHLVYDDKNSPVRIEGVFLDITDRISAEEKLKRNAERLRILHRIDLDILKSLENPGSILKAALDDLHDLLKCHFSAIAIFDSDSTDVSVLARYGLDRTTSDEFTKIPPGICDDLYSLSRGSIVCFDGTSAEKTKTSLIEYFEISHISASLSVPLYSSERIIGAIVAAWEQKIKISNEEKEILTEVAGQMAIAIIQSQLFNTTRRYSEELEERVKLRTSQLKESNNELEAFSYSVSHDLRAPLRHINGFVDLLLSKYGNILPEKGQHYLNTIVDSVKQMGLLIDDLLQFSRTGRQELTRSELNMDILINEVLNQMSNDMAKRNIKIERCKLPVISGDVAMLRLVWTNLISNALKFTRLLENSIIKIGFTEDERFWTFFISDNGVGFDMTYASKLFGVFQRLHPIEQFEGTGIGLANVKRIILKHGGNVWAESKPEEGATFYFSIPKDKEDMI